jgi:hypothetical protein
MWNIIILFLYNEVKINNYGTEEFMSLGIATLKIEEFLFKEKLKKH